MCLLDCFHIILKMINFNLLCSTWLLGFVRPVWMNVKFLWRFRGSRYALDSHGASRHARCPDTRSRVPCLCGGECRASAEESAEPLRRRVPSLCGGECRASAEESAEPLRRRVQHRASVHSRNAAFCSGTVLLRCWKWNVPYWVGFWNGLSQVGTRSQYSITDSCGPLW